MRLFSSENRLGNHGNVRHSVARGAGVVLLASLAACHGTGSAASGGEQSPASNTSEARPQTPTAAHATTETTPSSGATNGNLNTSNFCEWSADSPMRNVQDRPLVITVDARCNSPEHSDPQKDHGASIDKLPHTSDHIYIRGYALVVKDGTEFPVNCVIKSDFVSDAQHGSSEWWYQVDLSSVPGAIREGARIGYIPNADAGWGAKANLAADLTHTC